MDATKALGWSSTFMKQGIALFLLLLYNGKQLRKGMKAMLNKAVSACRFQEEAYCAGTGIDPLDDSVLGNAECFWELFCDWKETVSAVPEEDAARWLQRIEELLHLRTEGIMEANRRNYYGECAAFIAALGEVQESRGQQNAKEEIIGGYWDEYSRRRAFHQELKSFQD